MFKRLRAPLIVLYTQLFMTGLTTYRTGPNSSVANPDPIRIFLISDLRSRNQQKQEDGQKFKKINLIPSSLTYQAESEGGHTVHKLIFLTDTENLSIFVPKNCYQAGTPTKRQVSKRQVSKRLVSKRPVSKRQVYKTSGFKTFGFKTSSF